MTVQDGGARVFVAVDHANSEVVGCHVSKSGNRFEALEPIRQGVLRHFGSIGPGLATGLTLRHDHGSNNMAGAFQAAIKCLGITSSPSFVREPEGNGVAEHVIRTLKENFLWVYTFETVEELRRALLEFARHYNETWLVARHGHRPPAQVRAPPVYSSMRHQIAGPDLRGGEDDGNDDQPGCRGGRPKGERSGTRARPRRADVPPPALAEAPAKRKREAVLRLLRGEDLEVVSRQLGVTAATLSEWRESFLAAGEAALISRPADERDRQIERLKAKVGDLTLSNELLEAKIDHLEAHRPVARRRSRR